MEDGGYYYCTVSDGQFSVVSERAQLSPQGVTAPPDNNSNNGMDSVNPPGNNVAQNIDAPKLKVKLALLLTAYNAI